MTITRDERGALLVEDATIIFKNFAGRAGKFNKEGERSFALVIEDPELAQSLREEGWNVKIMPARTEDEGVFCYLSVAVVFPTAERNFPIKIVQFTKNGPVELNAETVGLLDMARFSSCKVAIRPYNWTTSTGSGIKAYLRTMHVVLEEGDFASDYDDCEYPFN